MSSSNLAASVKRSHSIADLTMQSSASNGSPGGVSLSKKIKLEVDAIKDTGVLKRNLIIHKKRKMRKVKHRYRGHLTELFYLQGGGNLVEFNMWKKRPSQSLKNFLDGSKLDSEDDDDEDLQEKQINDEVKVLTSVGSNVPLSTPVAISTTLSATVSSLNHQGMNSSSVESTSLTNTPMSTTSYDLKNHLSSKSVDVKPNINSLKSGLSSQQIASKGMKSSMSPNKGRQSITSVYETVTGGNQDVIVERAKQEAQVLQRVAELRKEGLWSAKRLPRVQEPPRQKAHWDYLLEEMTWLAADFIQERKWKKAAARKIARMVTNYFKELEQKEMRAEKEEAGKLKKIAGQMSKMVKEFWTNIEKVVQYKQTTRLDEKKKKALDMHLNFIVDQTEKYSSWLTAGLKAEGSTTSSLVGSDGEHSVDSGDAEFQPFGTASDDEETIQNEEDESGIDEDATKKEVEALQMESELPLEELLKTLPQEMLDTPSSDLKFDEESSDSSVSSEEKDGEFKVDEDDEDAEETIAEQEKHDKNYTEELDDLKVEGDMSVEELMKKYAGAYDSDFEVPEESSGEECDDGETSESEKESSETSEEEAAEEMKDEKLEDVNMESQPNDNQEDMGLEFLVKTENAGKVEDSSKEGPGDAFSDIAAAAQSLQPKGYTLDTTEVITKVPFLLKHTLREYQHVGLDWLATMYEKRLNGILADEMGLGKTIQTIALLAHLACDKGVWGPHLIVVPTSVMLNWEMEIKKWCPAFKILTYYGSIKERKLKRTGWTKTNAFHICITSYKLVVQDHQAFRRKKWKYFILDEAQNIKNFKSQRWQMLLNFSSQRRLLLTGTPLQNSLMELWSLMHFLMPNVFQSHSEFKEWFSNPLTGMIEGSQEYNESLVRRLHKVLRPFLLRRLKNEVEKQMPQKFEHVVMCRLSKRQRYLYDDFMAQSKTRETLTSGHFMSVINILMQLRKVCNHPNLFDPRPIVSPFKMEGIVYQTASLATKVLEHDPFKDIDIYSLYPNLAEMETDLPAFVAQRVKQIKASGKLIEEVDQFEEEPQRLPTGQLKNVRGAAAAFMQSGKVSSSLVVPSGSQSTPASPLIATKAPVSNAQPTASTVNSIKLLLPPTTSSSGVQQNILIPNPSGSGPPLILPLSGSSSSSTSSSTSAAIASAKLISSQLQSGLLQLVQTSTGHQIVAASSAAASLASATSTTTTASTNLSLLKLSSVLSQPKPVMRVSPFVVSTSGDTSTTTTSVATKSVPVPVVSTTEKLTVPSLPKRIPKKPMKRSELFLESLFQKKQERRQHILSHMAKLSTARCDVTPVLGSDVQHCVDCLGRLDSAEPTMVEKGHLSQQSGYVNCLFAQNRSCNHNRPDLFWRETKHLQKLVKSPEEWLQHLRDILARFVFVTPTVISPNVTMRVSHPCQSSLSNLRWLDSNIRPVIAKGSVLLHPIQSRTAVTFPELRLIQYDCGKLQVLDRLLRQLKTGAHRALIFTQMTKMLDVLECFLNFHGHRYLRLDGTTKVEQRQYLMDRFNADARIFCFILSTRSGGVGVNLTGADTVIFYDSDWNPTMDAQAQDRCHRIGQTRDVHIYRLVSEMTVEENILKKANQKRLLGDLAIEGGNFTTAFFKENTINDLFAEPSGLQSLAEDKEKEKIEKERMKQEKEKERLKERARLEVEKKTGKANSEKEQKVNLSQFEQALSKAEDETDANAIKLVQSEQNAELAEFDENIPWDEREAELRKEERESKVEFELAMLDKELSPIERYAVGVVETQLEPETAEELALAEEDIQSSKKGWELARLKALKEEEERKAELEDDEMLYIYSKNESQVKKKGRKPLKKKQNAVSPRGKLSDDDESPYKPVNGRRLSDRSPQISPNQVVRGSSSPEKRKVSVVKISKAKKSVDVKIKAALAKKKIPKGKVKAQTDEAKAKKAAVKVLEDKSKVKKVVINGIAQHSEIKVEKGKKGKAIPKGINQIHLQNGNTIVTLNQGKLTTQAKNALLKQQAQQAAHITINPSLINSPPMPRVQLQIRPVSSAVIASATCSPQQRPQLFKPSTPKSPQDPNVPPPWSNPNLVIRTRKAAVHSPVVVTQRQRPTLIRHSNAPILQQSMLRASFGPNNIPIALSVSGGIARLQALPASSFAKFQTVPMTVGSKSRMGAPVQIQTPVQIQSSPIQIHSSPMKIQSSPIKIQSFPNHLSSSLVAGGARLQKAPDRNIFQLFTQNSSGVTSLGGMTIGGQNIRQLGPLVRGSHVGNQIHTATLINPASIVNTSNFAGTRFITPGMSSQQGVVVSAPMVINASTGQTILNSGNGATIVNTSGGGRTILNTTRLTSPITLQGLGNLPVVNLLKTSQGLSLPMRQQVIQAPQLAQVAGQTGYVLISPRGARATSSTATTLSPAPTLQRLPTPVSIIQTLPVQQGSHPARVLLTSNGATIVQAPMLNKPATNFTSPHHPKPKGS